METTPPVGGPPPIPPSGEKDPRAGLVNAIRSCTHVLRNPRPNPEEAANKIIDLSNNAKAAIKGET